MKTKSLLLTVFMASLSITSFASVAIFPLSMIRIDCDSMITNYDGYGGNSVSYIKEVYEHDAQGKLTSLIQYEQSSTNNWTESGKEEYTYDSSGAMDRKIYWWDDSAQDWRFSAEWEYDAHGNLTAYSEYGDGIHRDYGDEYKYEYDSEGKAILNTHFMWGWETEDDWNNIPSEKTEYEYDAQGNLIKESTYSWNKNTNDWDPYIPVTTYEYDDQGREITQIYYNSCSCSYGVDGKINSFTLVGGTKYVTEYDAYNRKTSETKYTMSGPNDLTGTFVDRHEYEYDDQGNQISDNYYGTIMILLDNSYIINHTRLYIYYVPTGFFEKNYISSIYDEQGRISKQIQMNNSYALQDNITIPSDLYNVNLPSNAPSTFSVYWTPSNGNFNIVSTASEYWNAQWYYSDNQTGISPVNGLSKTTIFPSPATDFISISGLQNNEKFSIYNINGQQLLSRQASNEIENIPVSHLPAGIYFVKMSNGQTLKWVKK